MEVQRIVLTLAILAALAAPTRAGGPALDCRIGHSNGWHATWKRICCWCSDDYCPKPLPAVPCLAPGCCDTYCGKPLPPIPCLAPCGCCDDYWHKPIPCPPAVNCGPHCTCGPGECCPACRQHGAAGRPHRK